MIPEPARGIGRFGAPFSHKLRSVKSRADSSSASACGCTIPAKLGIRPARRALHFKQQPQALHLVTSFILARSVALCLPIATFSNAGASVPPDVLAPFSSADLGRFVHAIFVSRCNPTMRSSGPRGEAIVFPDVQSARGRLTRRWMTMGVLSRSQRARPAAAGTSGYLQQTRELGRANSSPTISEYSITRLANCSPAIGIFLHAR